MSKVYGYVQEQMLKIIDEAEKNGDLLPWQKKWKVSDMPRNGATGHVYRGINIWLTLSRGFASPFWYTRKQLNAKGGRIKKGEKSQMIVYFKWVDDKENEGKKFPILRYYPVWNLLQIDGIESPDTEDFSPFEDIQSAEDIIKNSPVRPNRVDTADKAAYQPATDTVLMPPKESFAGESAYYSTLFHEFGHATGHGSRLDRDLSGLFGDHAYSKEELVAEMTASFLCGVAGIERETIKNSAAYIQHWRKKISEDIRLVVQAGGQAQKAADHILGVQFSDS